MGGRPVVVERSANGREPRRWPLSGSELFATTMGSTMGGSISSSSKPSNGKLLQTGREREAGRLVIHGATAAPRSQQSALLAIRSLQLMLFAARLTEGVWALLCGAHCAPHMCIHGYYKLQYV